MNWSAYSRFAGDVFGAPLAMAALLAFFLESTFIGLLAAGGYYARIWAAAQAAGGWPPGEPAVTREPAGAAVHTAERTQL